MAEVEMKMSDAASDAGSDREETLELTLHWHNKPQKIELALSSTITDLAKAVVDQLSIPIDNQKYMIPKLGLQKSPFKDPSLMVETFKDLKVTLLGTSSEELQKLNEERAIEARRAPRRPKKSTVSAYKTHDWKKEAEEAEYTFVSCRPLPYLPKPEKSLEFLNRLKNDPGIKASMRKHKWRVPLLTEMNPVEHTTADMSGVSRTLGLNRNRGEVIELRLRTDAYDGYRDYKTIRKTLCHEMAHNVWGDHDANFWKLCKEIEKEVELADWKSGGHRVGDQDYYEPAGPSGAFGEDDEEIDDHGGWTGGEFVLGGATGSERPGNAGPAAGEGAVSRREVMARAAEERLKRMAEQGKGDGKSGPP